MCALTLSLPALVLPFCSLLTLSLPCSIVAALETCVLVPLPQLAFPCVPSLELGRLAQVPRHLDPLQRLLRQAASGRGVRPARPGRVAASCAARLCAHARRRAPDPHAARRRRAREAEVDSASRPGRRRQRLSTSSWQEDALEAAYGHPSPDHDRHPGRRHRLRRPRLHRRLVRRHLHAAGLEGTSRAAAAESCCVHPGLVRVLLLGRAAALLDVPFVQGQEEGGHHDRLDRRRRSHARLQYRCASCSPFVSTFSTFLSRPSRSSHSLQRSQSIMLINYKGEGLLAQSPYIATSVCCIVLDIFVRPHPSPFQPRRARRLTSSLPLAAPPPQAPLRRPRLPPAQPRPLNPVPRSGLLRPGVAARRAGEGRRRRSSQQARPPRLGPAALVAQEEQQCSARPSRHERARRQLGRGGARRLGRGVRARAGRASAPTSGAQRAPPPALVLHGRRERLERRPRRAGPQPDATARRLPAGAPVGRGRARSRRRSAAAPRAAAARVGA